MIILKIEQYMFIKNPGVLNINRKKWFIMYHGEFLTKKIVACTMMIRFCVYFNLSFIDWESIIVIMVVVDCDYLFIHHFPELGIA